MTGAMQWKMIGTIFTPDGQIVVMYEIPGIRGDEAHEVEEEIMGAAVARVQQDGCGYFNVAACRRRFHVYADVTVDHPVRGQRWHRYLQ